MYFFPISETSLSDSVSARIIYACFDFTGTSTYLEYYNSEFDSRNNDLSDYFLFFTRMLEYIIKYMVKIGQLIIPCQMEIK